MPPFIPRKRPCSTPPPDAPTPKPMKKPSIFETLDKLPASGTLQDNKAFLDGLNGSDTGTSLSDVSSAEFEDAFPTRSPKRRKLNHNAEDDEEVDWEDAMQTETMAAAKSVSGPLGDLELTLDKGSRIGSLTNPHDKKKGPSKIERQIRTATHCMHVQFLLFHNLMRNAWACDKEVQSLLKGSLTSVVKEKISKWRLASGMSEETASIPGPPNLGAKGRKIRRRDVNNERNQRDWGEPAERQEIGVPNMSRGDPVVKLLETLAAYWRQRFTVTAPSLRKQGYKSLEYLEAEIASFKTDKHDPEDHGEHVKRIEGFRDFARSCEGSRDIGVQLFTALLRSVGLEARLVASLQPLGFGWSKIEDASGKQRKHSKATRQGTNDESSSDGDSSVAVVKSNKAPKSNRKTSKSAKMKVRKKGQLAGFENAPVCVLGDSSDTTNKPVDDGEDDDSVIDITLSTSRKKSNMNYDKDIRFSLYWVEVISPITNEIYPVDPFILTPAVATSSDHLAAFESRGPGADKAKQVFAYVVAYSPGGTAKDVTTRYLKRHMWPGRTKGVRIPIEKVPVYNKKGKIKHYEEYDWFKTVMSGYKRTDKMRTAVDDLEDAKDLEAVKPEKKETKAGEETLQGYKTSAEFVLERHLRREEALLPGSKPVKTFLAGKGDNAKEEPVFRRKDVAVCRTSESWHKEGRHVKAGEHPIKMVPVRAVTLMRKREVEEAERDGGEKLKQGLYSWDQTDWIVLPPIENGLLPKNAFGNMDAFVPSMIPKGAVHIPLRSTMKICKRLGIDYAEAVTGFEFGKQRAVPVITGVVVAAEHEDLVIDEWEKDEEERRIKEEGKREKAALATWRKFLMGLRIVARVCEEYGGDADAHMKEEMNPFTNKNKTCYPAASGPKRIALTNEDSLEHHDEDMAGGFIVDDDVSGGEGRGGFLPEGYHEEVPSHRDETDFVIANEAEPVQKQSVPELSNLKVGNSNAKSETNDDGSDLSDPGETPPRSQTPSYKPIPLTTKIPKPRTTRSTKKIPKPTANAIEAHSPHPPLATTRPNRKSVRKSAKAVKSHYFAQSSEEDGDEGSSEESEGSGDGVAWKPTAKRGRGRPRNGGKRR